MTGGSCGACKFLRRRCMRECVFAPYFCYDQAAEHFAAVHKVFGASNVSKLLLHLPIQNRSHAAITISYQALARMRDPIYGCVSHIYALQQQVASLQEEIELLGNQMANAFNVPNYGSFQEINCPVDRYQVSWDQLEIEKYLISQQNPFQLSPNGEISEVNESLYSQTNIEVTAGNIWEGQTSHFYNDPNISETLFCEGISQEDIFMLYACMGNGTTSTLSF